MRLLATMLMMGLAAGSDAQTVPVPESYSVLLKNDGWTWCGYKDPTEFQAEATGLRPTERARITYSANELVELTYQLEAESGDWIVIDKYTPTVGGAVLRRENLFAEQGLHVIQEAVIRGDKADPFRVVSVSTPDGKRAELPTIDFSEISIRTNLSAAPFVQVVTEMRSRSLGKLCRKVD